MPQQQYKHYVTTLWEMHDSFVAHDNMMCDAYTASWMYHKV